MENIFDKVLYEKYCVHVANTSNIYTRLSVLVALDIGNHSCIEEFLYTCYPMIRGCAAYPDHRRNTVMEKRMLAISRSLEVDVCQLSEDERLQTAVIACYYCILAYLHKKTKRNPWKFVAKRLPLRYIRECRKELGKEYNGMISDSSGYEERDIPGSVPEYFEYLKTHGMETIHQEYFSFVSIRTFYRIKKAALSVCQN